MLDRYERDPGYGLIDMKFDLLTGRDFPDDDPIRGRQAVYGWIQGRALESLAGHAAFVGPGELHDRIVRVTRRLIDRTERLRQDAGGRLRFLMTPAGRAMTVDDAGRLRPIANDGPAHYTDLFYAKGLAAAAKLVGDEPRLAIARKLFDRVHADIVAGRFVSDQEQLDPKNPVRHVPGRVPHGPWMIAIGAPALLGRARGLAAIRHVLDRYTNPAGEMWELTDPAGGPLTIDGVLRNDPGHATEFAGLSLKLLRRLGEPPRELHERLCRVLRRNFELGFTGMGIVKTVDLHTGRPTNTDMPWWSLPETMRAAVEAWRVTRDADCLDIAARCGEAFLRYYLRPDRWLCANQTIDETGQPVARIPATPDVDPGYHTGLSLIDCLTGFE